MTCVKPGSRANTACSSKVLGRKVFQQREPRAMIAFPFSAVLVVPLGPTML